MDLEGCSQLTYLNLAFNLFTGPLPLAGVPRLRTLRVNNNRFLGLLPDALYELRQLQARARSAIFDCCPRPSRVLYVVILTPRRATRSKLLSS